MRYPNETEFNQVNVFGKGQENRGYAQYFIGDSFLNLLTDPKQCPLVLSNVTFEPGCRNNWHIHHAKEGGGQILICIAGEEMCIRDSARRKQGIPHCNRTVAFNPGMQSGDGAAGNAAAFARGKKTDFPRL